MSFCTVARVVIEKTVYRFDKPFDYIIPLELIEKCKPGCRVTVPFGRANAKRLGLVLEVIETKGSLEGLKNILSVIDSPPLINEEMLLMVKWLKEHTFCTYFDAVKTLLPFGLNLKIVSSVALNANASAESIASLSQDAGRAVAFLRKKGGSCEKSVLLKNMGLSEESAVLSELIEKKIIEPSSFAKQNMKDPTVTMVRLINVECDFSGLTAKQKSVVDLLLDISTATVKEVCYFAGVTQAVLTALEKKKIVEVFSSPVISREDVYVDQNAVPITLTEEQKKAYYTLEGDLLIGKPKADLLYGVTGSGKTSVFLKLVDKTVELGKTAIVMVPEISLTPQTLSKFKSRYGKKVAVFHSAMSLGQRMEEWKKAASGKAVVAVGTRSAVFAPLKNVGLIIMDEEQEHTYKSEQSPRFHAREVAKFRANYHNALLLLASATPSVESYSLAKSGKYGLVSLPHRYGNAVLPKVITVDMRREATHGNVGLFSKELVTRLSEALNDGKQAIILLNRRGHNTYISCPSCGSVFNCPNCSISLTYHSANKRLMCHYCGSSFSKPERCPTCKNDKLRFSGAGTQRADEELAALFPNARILRLDADTTMSRDAFEKGLKAFSEGEYDIMLGTQMVAKGLDFPRVTVVGVLSADQSMYSDDFRAFERTFSLLTQVIGRSGRGEEPGLAVVQTSTPESEIISLACEQNYDGFYNTEILTRRLMVYPPYCDIVMIGISASTQSGAKQGADIMFELVKNIPSISENKVKMIVLGPTAASVPRVQGKYRQRILIKTKNNAVFRKYMGEAMTRFFEKAGKDISAFLDVNPENII
ncbi:MAG: primosomal protein N' [Clostridia bacterium]|nr:primosomal protein N' [Clostridia bacterium]